MSTHQKDITIVNIYGPNNRAVKYMGQYLTDFKEKTSQQ